MFKIYVDRSLFCRSDSEELAIISPVVTLEANKAGTFEFTIPPTHPFYDAINTRTSVIDVFQNDTLIFEGFAVEQTVDFYKQKKVSCEGCFSYFNDSIQRQARYQNQTVRQLLTAYVTKHNEQVDDFKKFEVGAVTVTDSNNSIYCYTNNESTMSCLGADLVDDLGGYFRIRYENYELITDTSDNVITNTGDKIAVGARYLDYLSSSPRQNSQTIRIGKNLLEFSRNISSTDIATVCIPLGEKLDQQEVPGLDARLTIKSVNNGKDYIEATTVSTYGRVVRVVEFDKVTTASALKTKGEHWLSDAQFEKMVIEASAFDLSLSEDGFEDFQLLDSVRVVSEPHGLDRNFVITKLTYNLDAPESNTLTLGTETQAKISAQASKASGSSSEKGTVAYNAIQEAKSNATSIIESGGHGYVYFDYDEDHVIRSIMVMDTNDPNTATKRWVWNENGFGYEEKTDGEWLYRNAMTMDGAIVADFIKAGSMTSNNVRVGGWYLSESALNGGSEENHTYTSSEATTLIPRITDIMLAKYHPETLDDYTNLDVSGDGQFDSLDSGYLTSAKLNLHEVGRSEEYSAELSSDGTLTLSDNHTVLVDGAVNRSAEIKTEISPRGLKTDVVLAKNGFFDNVVYAKQIMLADGNGNYKVITATS